MKQIKVDNELHKRLKMYAASQGITIQKVVTASINEYMDKKTK